MCQFFNFPPRSPILPTSQPSPLLSSPLSPAPSNTINNKQRYTAQTCSAVLYFLGLLGFLSFIQDEPGFFPAVSLEEGEAVTVNLGQSPFVHGPLAGSKAVIAARPGVTAIAAQPRTAAAAAAGGGGGGGGAGGGASAAAVEEEEGEGEEGEERGPRTPVDLEDFSCASDLATRFGPNRLKVRPAPGASCMVHVDGSICGVFKKKIQVCVSSSSTMRCLFCGRPTIVP